MKDRYYAAVGVLLLVLVAVSWWWQKHDGQPTPTARIPSVKIGALLPLTGTFSEFGEDINNALALAREDIRARDDVDFVITIEDSGADPKTAVPAAGKLITIDHVPLIIAGPGSSANLAVAPLMKDTAFIAISTTPGLADKGELVMKLHPDIDRESARAVVLMRSRNLNRTAILFDITSATLVDGKDSFSRQFAEKGGTIADEEGFDGKNTSDFRSSILKKKAANPDSIYLMANSGQAGAVVKQIRDLGLTQPIFGWSAFQTPEFLSRAGAGGEGVIITAQPFSCDGNEVMRNYCQRYHERFSGREPLQYGAHAYDLLHILAQTIKEKNLAPSWNSRDSAVSVVATIGAIRHYQGISGDITFDEHRNTPDKNFVFRIVKDGKFIDLK